MTHGIYKLTDEAIKRYNLETEEERALFDAFFANDEDIELVEEFETQYDAEQAIDNRNLDRAIYCGW